MTRCKHLNAQLVEDMTTELVWQFRDGKRFYDGWQNPVGDNGGSAKCLDCGRVYVWGKNKVNHPRWVKNMLDQLF